MSRSLRPSTVKKSLEFQNKLDKKENKSRGENYNKKTNQLSSVSNEVNTVNKSSVIQYTVVIEEEEEYWEDTTAYSFTSVELIHLPVHFRSRLLIRRLGRPQSIVLG